MNYRVAKKRAALSALKEIHGQKPVTELLCVFVTPRNVNVKIALHIATIEVSRRPGTRTECCNVVFSSNISVIIIAM